MSTYGLSSSSPFSSSSVFGGFCSGNNRRPSMFTAKYRQREERKKILKMSLTKVKRIEDPESFLCRSVLINNTIKTLQREVREEKMMRHGGNGGGYLSKLSLHSSFRKSFTSSSPRLNEPHHLCASSSEELNMDDDGPLLSPSSPPPTIIIPNLPCISTTTTSFTSSTPSSTTCHQLVNPLSNNNNNHNSNTMSDNDNSSSSLNSNSYTNGISNNCNSRKRMLSADDSEDDCCDVDAVLSQIYIPPTPCIISSMDDGDDCCDSSTSLSTCSTRTTSSSATSQMSFSCSDSIMSQCTSSDSKRPKLSSSELILNGNDGDHCSSSTSSNGISYTDNVIVSSSSSSCSFPALTAFSASQVTSSSAADSIVDVDVDDIDVDVVGDCETSDWPTLPIHYESSISSSTTTIITTTSCTVTNTLTTTTNSCLTHLPIHQFSLDDELDLSTPSPLSQYSSISTNNQELENEDDEMTLLDNTKENTCTLPFLSPCTSSSSFVSNTSSSFYCCSPASSPVHLPPVGSPDQLNKCSSNPFIISSAYNNSGSTVSCNNNNNNEPNIDESSLDKQLQPPSSPSQYSSCGHSTIFGELQSVVFHSLITSLET